MKFVTLITAAAMSLGLSQVAKADVPDGAAQTMELAQNREATPPADHKGQWWTHPKGCEYSRAGRPRETVWYLIINTARPGCPSYIVGHSPYNDVY